MIIRRLTLSLPARMRPTAAHDARAIAEAVARAMPEPAASTQAPLRVSVEERGLSGATLGATVGAAVAARLSGGGRHGR